MNPRSRAESRIIIKSTKLTPISLTITFCVLLRRLWKHNLSRENFIKELSSLTVIVFLHFSSRMLSAKLDDFSPNSIMYLMTIKYSSLPGFFWLTILNALPAVVKNLRGFVTKICVVFNSSSYILMRISSTNKLAKGNLVSLE
ncbi:hypothetical protein BpHYR1_001967 [Brachionus plicatilis]|uniref:Uncharacterized protein n=1 Tax=Brachionus plicatilis TaxID=10195 RepID=A0A3M7RSX6_BRAPC|nr:hypothetical protein BpHYR1_001967 [Brachionus plicatilis]